MNPDVGNSRCCDGAQHFHHTVLEGLAADKPNLGIVGRLPKKMLTTAETNLKPGLCCGWREEGSGVSKRSGI